MENRPYQDFLFSIDQGKYTHNSVRLITFQITDSCDCACSYCYQINKGQSYMSQATAKQCVDLLFEMYEKDEASAYINKNTEAIIFEFIGGEPLLNVEIIDFICSYFLKQCVIKKQTNWIIPFRISMISNGQSYFNEKVQSFLKKWQNYLSFSITIDGPKDMHDSCRKTVSGEGTFDQAYQALLHYKNNYSHNTICATKVTVSPENLPFLNSIFDFFIENNIVIYSNPIYEHNWTIDEGSTYYQCLKKFADKLLLSPGLDNMFFVEDFFVPMDEKNNENWCGGTGAMICFDPNGTIYPCLRYMESSLGDEQKPLVIGNINEGVYKTETAKKIQQHFSTITRRSQSTDECFYCPIAAGCSWCSAYNYQATGDPNIRVITTCNMHKAKSLANVYYWNKYYKQHKINKVFKMYLPKEEALKFISLDEYQMLYELQLD